MIVPPLIALTRLLIQKWSGSLVRLSPFLHQAVDAFGYTLGTHSEETFISGSDRVFLFSVALYTFLVNLIFSGMLFEEQLTRFDPPAVDRVDSLTDADFK